MARSKLNTRSTNGEEKKDIKNFVRNLYKIHPPVVSVMGLNSVIILSRKLELSKRHDMTQVIAKGTKIYISSWHSKRPD